MTAVNADTLSELSDQKETLQQQQQELEDRSNALNEQLEQLKDDEDKQQQYYTSLEKQIDVVEEQIDTANQRLEQLDEEISQTESDMADAQVQLEEDYDTLKQRLCALYKLGSAGTLEIILQAESLPDLAQKTEVMSAITRHDTQLIDSIHQQLETLEEQKQLLHDDREEADQLRTSLEEKKSRADRITGRKCPGAGRTGVTANRCFPADRRYRSSEAGTDRPAGTDSERMAG